MIPLNLTVCLMHRNNTFDTLYEHIPTWEEADLIAQYAMCMRTNYDDVVFVFPGWNRSINEKPELWKKAAGLAQKYIAER